MDADQLVTYLRRCPTAFEATIEPSGDHVQGGRVAPARADAP